MKILIVEDEQELRETIRTSLLKEKFVVETAADYFSALDKINDYDYDCVLLDIMLTVSADGKISMAKEELLEDVYEEENGSN